MAEIRYSVGDKVKIKSFNWYYQNKDKNGYIFLINSNITFTPTMAEYCGKEMTISSVDDGGYYQLTEDVDRWRWSNEMFE